MKKINFLLLLLSNCIFAQINFEKGYLIDNNNSRKECFIKNEDWKNNPTLIEYKLSENDNEVKTATLAGLSEFSVGEFLLYKKYKVKIDMSSFDTNKLSRVVEPEYVEKEVFLKTIVSGNATLYEYKETGIKKFFYSINNSNPIDLIHKKYIPYKIDNIDNYTDIYENKNFQRQLYKDVNCNGKSINDFLKLKYFSDELTNHFIAFNNCNSTENNNSKDYRNTSNNNNFNFKIKTGVNFKKFSITDIENTTLTKDFSRKPTYVVGAEFEYVFPFNNNKWSIFLESIYNSKYEDVKTYYTKFSSFSQTNYENKANFSSIMITPGLHYKMFLNKNVNLFISPFYTIEIPSGGDKDNLYSGKNIGFGLGVELYKKWSIEGRMLNTNFSTEYYSDMISSNVSVIIAYKIFENKK